MSGPTDAEIEAAAMVLDRAGRFHRWWPEGTPEYRDLDPIGKDEFDAIVEQMLTAAEHAKSSHPYKDVSSAASFLPPGTRVRYDGLTEGGPEYGVVVHCWMNDEINAYDCYVAFFGNQFPSDGPREKPCVLRYAATSLRVVD